MVKLSGLKHLCKDDDILVVLTPASKIEDVPLKGRLRHEKIIQTSLASSLNPQTFELPIKKLISGLLKAKTGEEAIITELFQKQRKDYKRFEYQCYDKVYISGLVFGGRSTGSCKMIKHICSKWIVVRLNRSHYISFHTPLIQEKLTLSF